MTRPMTWMTAVRDHPDRPPAVQRHVLNSLALRMDWSTGCGFASTGQLAADADATERTVRRATAWARGAALLMQTRRGHRINAERVIASEWRLILPESQPDTGVLLESQPDRAPKPTGHNGRPNRTAGHHHLELGPQDLVPSARGNGAKAPMPPRGTTTNQRVQMALEAGKRLQAMFDARRPECWGCGEPIPLSELHPDDLEYATRGQLLGSCCENLTDEEIAELRRQR